MCYIQILIFFCGFKFKWGSICSLTHNISNSFTWGLTVISILSLTLPLLKLLLWCFWWYKLLASFQLFNCLKYSSVPAVTFDFNFGYILNRFPQFHCNLAVCLSCGLWSDTVYLPTETLAKNTLACFPEPTLGTAINGYLRTHHTVYQSTAAQNIKLD